MKRVLLFLTVLLVVLALFAACGEDAPDLPDTGETTTTEAPAPTVYTITYELNGGTNAQSNPATYTAETATIAFADPTRTGYTFAGWSITSIPQGSTGNKTVTASWTPIVYTITYELNGGTNAQSNPATYTIESETIAFADPTRTSYDFAGWDIATIPQGSTGNKTVTARWSLSDSKGLVFVTNEDGTCYLSDIGTCEDAMVVIPAKAPNGDTVTAIGYQAFYGCNTITSVVIPSSVTTIGSDAFDNCVKLTGITIPKSVTEIGESICYGCVALESITVESGNENYYSAGNCLIETATKTLIQGCKNSEIPADVTSIADYAFCACGDPESVTIPKSVKSIGKEAFSGCAELASVTFEDGSELTSIGEGAFYKCVELTGIVIPKGVTEIGDEAFYGCSKLASVTFGENSKLTSLGEGAFYKCVELTGIVIPKGVTEIGDEAFYGCSKLASVTFEENSELTIIWQSVFYGCQALESIAIPESVTQIGNYAFGFCQKLTSITIPKNVGVIGAYGFVSCTNLESITFEEGSELKTVGMYLFMGCTKLESIVIPNGATTMANSVFDNCTALTSVTIPKSMETIGNSVFNGCGASLTDIYYLGTEAQWNAINKSSNWDYGLSDRCEIHFSFSEGLEFQSNEDGTCYVKGIGTCTDTDIDIPPVSPDGDTVTAIGNGAFDSKAITSVRIPAGVTTIGQQAFYGCTALTSVEIPEGVESILLQAFSGCTALTSVTIPTSVMTIGDFAFNGCESLADIYYDGTQAQWDALTKGTGWDSGAGSYKVHYGSSKGLEFESNEDGTCTLIGIGECTDTDLVIPNKSPDGDTVTAIGAGAFSYETLTSVFIPNTVKTIGESAFYCCEDMVSVIFEDGSALTLIDELAFNCCYALESINIPKSVETIGDDAFNGCTALTGITIPASVTNIEGSAFYHCSALESVTFEAADSQLTSIGASAFSGCTALTGILIPKGVETIGDNAFYGCSELASLIFEADSQLTTIGESAFGDTALVSVTIPKRVTSIGMYAFSCDTLETVEFEAGSELETIGYGAFYRTALTEITIPASVTCIWPSAFDGCTALGSVTFENETGWYITKDEGATGGAPADVTDPNDNANYLQGGNFGYYYWYRA